ncbi:carbon-nitrogen hydrolase family protein [Natrarchaeobius chitinivorans]|uniref:Carbon-nitrogen hydrolase family protein n=1 Tax=Natrarchaeobius chitinivorans TaxID=1679083 RepID=A0A3N6LQM9_NATCH|nr:carbon-nitrogen hydrolase family protein [Natrarchaeobius chitinivorans]RQG91933.1 carbon-nitrogen hydrolase family protein [Natrarchaeobius chitinivorans]
MTDTVRVAAVQQPPVFFDREATIERACELVETAGRQGADLVAFPESYVAGYPGYYTPGPAADADEQSAYLLALQESAVRVPQDVEPLAAAADDSDVVLVVGCNERDQRPGSETIYNTNLVFDSDGTLVGRHRKLVPTFTERLYWGRGDDTDVVFETDVGRVGTLICWENHMPLARAHALHQGETFHVCNWPGSWGTGERYLEAERSTDCDCYPAIREQAFSANAFVVSAHAVLDPADVPDRFHALFESECGSLEWACGGSCVVDPFGQYVAGPVFDDRTILYHDCDLEKRQLAAVEFDQPGHYSRDDVFDLQASNRDDVVSSPDSPTPLSDLTDEDVALVSDRLEEDPDRIREILGALADVREDRAYQ